MLSRVIPFCAALALLAGMTAERFSLQPTKSAVAFHERVKAAAEKVPLRFGLWVGEEQPITADAKRMLRPNVVMNRKYRNMSTGQEVGFLFVQCDDARAIMDHYPPICYVTQGYDKDLARPVDWRVGPLSIAGTEYEFSRRQIGQERSIVVDNFIVMPTGTTERDMEAAKRASADPKRRFFGAAQFQLVFTRGVSGDLSAEDSREVRNAVFETFVGCSRPMIEAAESGLIH